MDQGWADSNTSLMESATLGEARTRTGLLNPSLPDYPWYPDQTILYIS